MAFLRVMILIWADLLAGYVMWIMQTYLTDVWKVGFTHAAGIMNVATGLSKVLPLVFYYFVDAGLSNYWMLLLSSLSYVIGLGLLSMSTPPVLARATGTCKRYEPRCIGHTQKALFYTSLALIAVGISGHIVSLVALFVDQFEKKPETKPLETNDRIPEIPSRHQPTQMFIKEWRKKKGLPQVDMPNYSYPTNQSRSKPDDSAEVDLLSLQFQPVEAMLALVTKEKKKVKRACILVLVPVITIFVFPYIKPWSLRFGIPAICTLVAFLFFLHGSREYKEDDKSEGTPATNVFKVILAATLKMLKRLPSSSELYENNTRDAQKLPHTHGLRFLDKAAIDEGLKSRRWLLCTVTEVEQTKIVIHMIPIWITLIICGLVTAMGNTYFVEQANHMNYKLGKWKLPDSLLLILYTSGKSAITSYFGKRYAVYAPRFGIALATISSALCCMVAAVVETRRIHVIRDHGLINKPDEDIPMTVFYLVPQYLLLAGLDSFYENSVIAFLSDQSPPSMQKYLVFLTPGLSGLGIIGSVLSVYVVGRVSEIHGKPNWFQYTLNGSRLDRYYWTIAGLSAANFLWFSVSAILYPYRELPSNAGYEEEMGNGLPTEETTDDKIRENQENLSA